MKKLLILAALALAVSSTASASPWIKTFAQAQQKAKTKNQLIFVDLWAEWCGWCHKFEQDVVPSQAFQNATDSMVLLRLNTEDQGDGTNLARRFPTATDPCGQITYTLRNDSNQMQSIGRIDYQRTKDDTIFGRYMATSATAPIPMREGDTILDLAKEFRVRYALPQAEERFKKLTAERTAPANVRDESFYELALTQLLQKKYDDSMATIQKFSTVTKKGEQYEKSRLLMGDVYLQQGKFDRAVAEYRNFKAAFPQSPYVKNVDMVLPQIEQRVTTSKKP